MAHTGSRTAASRLSDLAGIEVDAECTKIRFLNRVDLDTEFDPLMDYVSIRMGLSGGPGGSSVVVFDESSAAHITDAVLDATSASDFSNVSLTGDETDRDGIVSTQSETFDKSTLVELSHMLNCGFIDGWANVLNTSINVTPPTVSTGSSPQSLFGLSPDFDTSETPDVDSLSSDELENRIVLVFQSSVDIAGSKFSFRHYLFPDISQTEAILKADRSSMESFNFEKLVGFDYMVEEGAHQAASSFSQLAGVDAELSVRDLAFVPVENLPDNATDSDQIGVLFTYNGTPSGRLLILFKEESAKNLVGLMGGSKMDSTLKELGNIMTSGVLDGWANVLGTVINHSTPSLVHDTGENIMQRVAADVENQQDHAFVFDTTIEADEQEVDCSIFSVCEKRELERALSQLDMKSLHETTVETDYFG